MVGEPTAWRLLSIHNLAFVLGLMAEARTAIAGGPSPPSVPGRPRCGRA